MKKYDFSFKYNIFKKPGSKNAILLSWIACTAVASIITTSVFAAISHNKDKKDTPSQVAERSTFEAAFPMAAWKTTEPTACPSRTAATEPTPSPTPAPGPSSVPDSGEEKATREAAKKSAEAAVTPKTGSVLTSSEYKYDPNKDGQQESRNENVDKSSADTIVAINTESAPSPTATSPQQTPSPTANVTPDQEPSPTANATPTTPSTPTDTPSPTQPVYADGWNILDGKPYYCINNSFLKGWADIGGFRYYFDQSSGMKMSRVGIDVSYYQGTIDWNKVKAAGVDFAIIRVGGRYYGGGGLYADSFFEKNIKGASAAGIECGVYFFSAAIDEVEGAQEANFILNAIKDYNITGPLVIDMECRSGRTQYLSRSLRTNITLTALEVLNNSGHKAMLYTGYSFYKNDLEPSRLTSYPLWIAYYTSDYNKVSDVPYSIWQYTSSGSISGIDGRVDLNIWK